LVPEVLVRIQAGQQPAQEGGRVDAAAIVLAAGDGKRLKSAHPKVLHVAAGRPLLCHVFAALERLDLDRRVVVASPRYEEIRAALAEHGFGGGIDFAVQYPARGTADAARVGLEALGSYEGRVVILQGDTPLIEADTIFRMLQAQAEASAAAVVLTATVKSPTGYGRIIRSGADVERIVEERDASPIERRIHEVNAGVYVFDAEQLTRVLAKVDCENAQNEYYLPDVIALLRSDGQPVAAVKTHPDEIGGVNNRSQLAYVSGLIRHRVCERWMAEGVSIIDPDTTYIDTTVTIERDAIIHPFTFLEGNTRVSERAEVGPQARIVDSSVGPGAVVTFAVVRGSEIGPDAQVGPFASLRPGTVMKRASKIGTFVESKQSVVGEGSKANHLTYLGNAQLGKGVNVGAGTVTCNWDGQQKHETVIEDDAYISSDTMLIAPVRIGRRAATGAGAVVRDDVPDDGLAVGMPARIIEGRGDRMSRKVEPEDEDESLGQ
jgi:bifunctional UDP-N-acetylglucosamine pyrophosphorylase / glucosamine-1-phosphate N-acetyltransferase